MYAYGYREMKKAREVLVDYGVNDNPCQDCSTCTVRCVKGFHVKEKLADISRIANMPEDFLV